MNNETKLNRRSFAKKSLIAGIIASQPVLLTGLLRAQGGSGSGTSNNCYTTNDAYTTETNTTGFGTGTATSTWTATGAWTGTGTSTDTGTSTFTTY